MQIIKVDRKMGRSSYLIYLDDCFYFTNDLNEATRFSDECSDQLSFVLAKARKACRAEAVYTVRVDNRVFLNKDACLFKPYTTENIPEDMEYFILHGSLPVK